MPRRLAALSAHATAILVGLVLLTWPVTFGANPRIECRGVEMHAGDVCHKAELDGTDRGKVQTYEERLAAKKAANPVIAVVGLAVTGFAGYLLVGDHRRRNPLDADDDAA